jgi:hypothetical protein
MVGVVCVYLGPLDGETEKTTLVSWDVSRHLEEMRAVPKRFSGNNSFKLRKMSVSGKVPRQRAVRFEK